MAADTSGDKELFIELISKGEEIINEIKNRLWFIELFDQLSSFIKSRNLILDMITMIYTKRC